MKISKRCREVVATWLECGQNQHAAARVLKITQQGVCRHVQRAKAAAEENGVAIEDLLDWTTPGSSPEFRTKVEGDELSITASGRVEPEQLLARVNADEWVCTKLSLRDWTAQSADGLVELGWGGATFDRRPWYWTPGVEMVGEIPAPSHERAPDTPARALIIPDSQHGFLANEDGTLTPLHNEAACSVAVGVAQMIQPEEIILLGDMLDLAGFSTHRKHPRAKYTTNFALRALHVWLRQLREACPNARITYLEGNHEERINRVLTDTIDEMVGVRPVGEEREAVSLPRLLALDKLHVDYIGPYGEDYWLWDRVRIHHGHVVGGGSGKTVSKIVNSALYDEIVGHIHRREWVAKKIRVPKGFRTVEVLSPGCLCWTDGRVPAQSGRKGENWQNGLVLAQRLSSWTTFDMIKIRKGECVVWGQLFRAPERVGPITRQEFMSV